MDFKVLIIVLIVVVFVLAVVFFPEFRQLIIGFARSFVEDTATTPAGAEAIYSNKIKEAQEAYNKADDVYKTQAGKLNTAQKQLAQKKDYLQEVSHQCENLVRSGNMSMAEIKAEEREEIISDIKRLQELVNVYTKSTNQAKEMHEMCETTLRKLKKEKKEVVENMKVKQQVKEAYDDMDELKNISPNDKLLDSIREKNKDLDASVEGARVVHDSRLSTKIQKAEKESKKMQCNDYLESLKKKYNK